MPPAELVVVPLPVMLAVADYLAQRPYREVAPLAVELQQLTTLKEYNAARRARRNPDGN